MRKLFLILLFNFVFFMSFCSPNDLLLALDPNEINELTLIEKIEIYNSLKMDTIYPTLLNATIGLGSGSFLQGDYITGGFCLALDVIAFTSLGFGIAVQTSSEGPILIGIGIGSYILSKIFQLILPQRFAASFNYKLTKKLFLLEGY